MAKQKQKSKVKKVRAAKKKASAVKRLKLRPAKKARSTKKLLRGKPAARALHKGASVKPAAAKAVPPKAEDKGAKKAKIPIFVVAIGEDRPQVAR